MIRLYDANCKEFNNNGIGILRDTLKCEVSEELNGQLVVNMEYPITSRYIEYIKNENIIKCDAGFDEEQLFRIKNVKPNLDTVTIYAEHMTYDLIDNILEDVFPQNLNGIAAGDWILSHTQYSHLFTFFSDISKVASARYVRKNPIEAIIGDLDNSFINLWGGELKRDNFRLSMLSIRGNDNGYKIKYRKNLTGLDFTIDNTNIVTKIMPQGYNGLLLPEKYVDSPIINQYPHPKIKIIEFSDVKVKENEEDEEGFATVEEAYEELRRLSKLKYSEESIDKPLVNLKVDFVELSRTTEYKKYSFLGKVAMGDIVSVELDYTNVNVRVIKTTYDSLLHRFIALELGEFKNDYITSNKKLINENKDISARLDAQGNLINSQGQLINSQGELINKYGTRIDEQGRLIDSQGNLINEQGQRIDAQGKLLDEQKTQIDAQGNLIDEQGRLIDSQGNLINEQGKKIDEQGNLINEQEQQLSSQQILLDEHGNLINEHGQKIDSQGNLIKEVSDKVATLPTEEEILNQAKENATNLITKATNGHVVLRPAENPTEILIMDTPDINTAQKIWRWNLKGLGYSSNGINGPYEQAMTQDGQIVADFIKTRNIKCKFNKSRNYEC